ncbi:putative peptidoglycan glycosyltransferase FtsW [Ureibacillus sp. FSL K6-8385]|uniref:Probable peptidoglycan glycosyltransferase FtsW n=1 Tax=Ureibacillus terrenus TaxID=118246 RepID=A0A540V434_9BACL|nr:putative peptidoglycan glycosyltransferase FtsW [Ureibacillus terrenus]MED3660277.1 putative peptidoglycan glycosyltransferase FtsW [Ureibacillus terrenus]MED3764977.1 putative peptidoglycan glycosyltransferase FtsW [Ureibacillus terrenus]TQE91506.1 cell division protein FtsW [Ureibacillus terrenus]
MRKYLSYYFRNFDYPLFFDYVFLCLFGLVMIYSSSIMVAMIDGHEPDYYYKKQLMNLLVAFFSFAAGAFLPYKHYSRKNVMVFMVGLILALMVWVFFFGVGESETGSKSWINLFGIMTFQPSELAKLIIILYFAGAFYRKSLKTPMAELSPNHIIYPIIVWILIIFFVANETDIGAVAIISGIAIAVVAASGIRIKTFFKFFAELAILGAGIIGMILLIKGDQILTPNRLGRIKAFLNPFEYEQGSGHQVIQGYIAIGSGGLKGVGLGQSVQKLGYLPEPQTDFIMAVIAEELGLVGVIIVLASLGFIVFRALIIALTTKDPLARMITAGIASWIAIQTFINLGGLSGLIPLTGVTLPFISYGGSSILVLSFAIGILINISMYEKLEKRKHRGWETI